MGRIGVTRFSAAAAVVGFCCFVGAAKAAESPNAAKPLQSQKRFEEAIRDDSTSPFFILFTIVDDRTGTVRAGCATANLFLGAIHREYGLAYDRASLAKAVEIALASPDHVFHFSKQAALDNIPGYSEQALISARKTLSGLNEQQILGARFQDDAIGCAIVERGLSAREGDRGHQITAVP